MSLKPGKTASLPEQLFLDPTATVTSGSFPARKIHSYGLKDWVMSRSPETILPPT